MKRSKITWNEKKSHHLYCPMECNKERCYNRPRGPTQCYKLEQIGRNIETICEPFINEHNGTCRPDFHHCAIAEPERNKKYSIYATDDVHFVPSQFVTIKGYNLHECLQFLVVKKNSTCGPMTIEKNLMESEEILKEPVLSKVLYNEILFENIKISTPGEYNICLAQFYQDPEKDDILSENSSNKYKKKKKNDMKVLGIDTIGTLYVLPLHEKQKTG
ncbi:hypothetical protein PFMALIP_00304 [Plasmodium falciparum MaliPS096_E11]|nr:hypothetical protein PFMALIP_00304 [Plasmodium falciparum MaliPS096_E11]